MYTNGESRVDIEEKWVTEKLKENIKKEYTRKNKLYKFIKRHRSE